MNTPIENAFRSLLDETFSVNGVLAIVAVIGFLSGAIGLFGDTSVSISIKWLIASVAISLSLLVIQFRLLIISQSKNTNSITHVNPFKYLEDKKILLVKRNELFKNSILVGCYLEENEVEILAYLGAIVHFQDDFFQVKILKDYGTIEEGTLLTSMISQLRIKAVIPFDAIEDASL